MTFLVLLGLLGLLGLVATAVTVWRDGRGPVRTDPLHVPDRPHATATRHDATRAPGTDPARRHRPRRPRPVTGLDPVPRDG